MVVWTGKDPVRAHGEFFEVVLWRRKESAACTDPTQPLQALGSLQRSSSSCENIEHQKQISGGSRLFLKASGSLEQCVQLLRGTQLPWEGPGAPQPALPALTLEEQPHTRAAQPPGHTSSKVLCGRITICDS